MTAEAEAARREAHAQKALARTLQEQQRLLDDEALQQETTIKDLRNELADKEVALQNAQRKLFQARTSRCPSLAIMHAFREHSEALTHSPASLVCTSCAALARLADALPCNGCGSCVDHRFSTCAWSQIACKLWLSTERLM